MGVYASPVRTKKKGKRQNRAYQHYVPCGSGATGPEGKPNMTAFPCPITSSPADHLATHTNHTPTLAQSPASTDGHDHRLA
eukprot:1190124-Prorocentrum_minimum.AAC.5